MPKHDPSKSESFPARLKRACEGLNFVSETDSDVVPVFGTGPGSRSMADVLTAIGVSSAKGSSETDLEEFFSRLTKKKEWFSEAQRANAARFKALKLLLQEGLADLKVFRVGKIQITIYVLGIDSEGNVAGVKMNAIET